MKFLALAARGLARNRRRSITTISAICLGFSAIALFAGYTHNVYRGLSLQAVHGELLGHLTISRIGMQIEGKLYPERYLLSSEDISRLTKVLESDSHVELVTPRLALSGIISNGKASTIFVAEGLDPDAVEKLQADSQDLAQSLTAQSANDNPDIPEALRNSSSAVAAGLARLLRLAPGDQAVLLSNTLHGQANAVDIDLTEVFDTGNAATNDLYAFLPLELTRWLYDTPAMADRLTVLIDDIGATEEVRTSLQNRLKAAGFDDMEIKTWNELSAFYTQVRSMFDMIFSFILFIVLTVALMSVANSMAMTVTERTREIGTLRAIGLRKAGVVRLFVIEGMLLIGVGCIAGLLLTLLVRAVINGAAISYVPPNSTSPVELLVDLDMARIAFTAMLMTLVGGLASWLPAKRAAKQTIIDALGHV
jgi:putative ABC transport system permease protein